MLLPVAELSIQSASWLDSELAIRKLAYLWVVQLPTESVLMAASLGSFPMNDYISVCVCAKQSLLSSRFWPISITTCFCFRPCLHVRKTRCHLTHSTSENPNPYSNTTTKIKTNLTPTVKISHDNKTCLNLSNKAITDSKQRLVFLNTFDCAKQTQQDVFLDVQWNCMHRKSLHLNASWQAAINYWQDRRWLGKITGLSELAVAGVSASANRPTH